MIEQSYRGCSINLCHEHIILVFPLQVPAKLKLNLYFMFKVIEFNDLF